MRWELYTLAAILTIFSAAVLYKDWTGGITVDEPVHLVSAHVYWHGGQTLPPRDMPPLRISANRATPEASGNRRST